MDLVSLVSFVFSGLLGGIASSLLWAKDYSDIKSFYFVRGIILGAIGGYLYFLMHTEWNLPNGVVAFAFGYAFKDIIDGIVNAVLPKFTRKTEIRTKRRGR